MDGLLLVEGWIDKTIVQSIIELNQSKPEIDITPCGGIDKLIAGIKGVIRAENYMAVGIMVDANSNPINRWNMISDQVKATGINMPDVLDPSGVIIDGQPRVGVWLMPDNRTPGEIEDFVAKLIPHNDPIWPKSQRYIDSIPEYQRRFPSAKITKAKTFAWVSTRKRPGLIDSAINRQDLDLSRDSYKSFVGWLEELYQGR